MLAILAGPFSPLPLVAVPAHLTSVNAGGDRGPVTQDTIQRSWSKAFLSDPTKLAFTFTLIAESKLLIDQMVT